MAGKIDRQTREQIEGIVEEKLKEMLGDPDEGLELRKAVRERLEKSLAKPGKAIPAADAARKLGLKW